MLPTPWIAIVLPLSALARSAGGVLSVMPAASATSLRKTSSTIGRSTRLAMAKNFCPCAAARRNTGPVPMVKSALPANTALGEATPTRFRVETLRPSLVKKPASSATKCAAKVSVRAGRAIVTSVCGWPCPMVGGSPSAMPRTHSARFAAHLNIRSSQTIVACDPCKKESFGRHNAPAGKAMASPLHTHSPSAARRVRIAVSLGARGDQVLVLVLLLAVWQGLTLALGTYWIGSPWGGATRLASGLASGEILRHASYTLLEAAAGFLIGALPAVALPFALRRLPILSAILDPFMMGGYGAPKLALAPLFILWFGIGIASKIALVA